jgi:predicted nucleotidyltransferase
MTKTYSDFESNLVLKREELSQKIIDTFRDLAIECHLFGSTARGDSDSYSDIDIWFTFEDKNIQTVIEKRLEYFSKIGKIVLIQEAPQNSPIGGKYSCVLFKIEDYIIHVDFYFCPLSTSFITKDSKKIFSDIDLPKGEIGLNPQKVLVDKNYRIDFFIAFVFGGIKKLVRNDEKPLNYVLREYSYLRDRYDIKVEPLIETKHSFETLKIIISNIMKVSNEKQRLSLVKISDFLKQVELN